VRAFVGMSVLFASGCANKTISPVIHASEMRGFTAEEAHAVVRADVLDVCSVRSGQLVVEVVDAIVREWPQEPGGALEHKKQPLLLTELHGPGTGTGTSEVVPLVAPEGYAKGESLRFFVGRRLLVRPMRTLDGRVLTVRLAKNNRTAEPLWEPYARLVGQAAAGAAPAVGLPSVPSAALEVMFEIVRRLTPDDRVLEWTTTISALSAQLGPRESHKTLRLRLETPRSVGGVASAELGLLVYLEPEPDCSVRESPAPTP